MKYTIMTLCIGLLLVTSDAIARDTIHEFSIEDALALEQSKSALGQEVRFFFGDQSPGKVVKTYGEFGTNKKTNAFNKSDLAACQWAFLSAMLSLRDRALQEGGNAVINIKSNYKGNRTSSNTTFKCGAGATMAGVALLGTAARIE